MSSKGTMPEEMPLLAFSIERDSLKLYFPSQRRRLESNTSAFLIVTSNGLANTHHLSPFHIFINVWAVIECLMRRAHGETISRAENHLNTRRK